MGDARAEDPGRARARVRLSVYASRHWRHLAPIVDALVARGVEVDCWAEQWGAVWGPAVATQREKVGPVVMVASPADADRWKDRAVVFVEHGAGQTYTLPAHLRPQDLRFSGSPGLEQVRLFVCPSHVVADRWRTRYPQAYAQAVGCPALDRHLGSAAGGRPARGLPDEGLSPPRRPLVAVTAHWQMGGADLPEADPALPHHASALPQLAERYELVGHAHPRAEGRAKRFWAELGVPYEPDPDRILATADLLIADSTSLLYEAAAIGLPTVVLNCPTYRRHVHHGLRFWDAIPGIQCDEPADLPHTVTLALQDAPPWPAVRAHAAAAAYAHRDGHASDRAADAIVALLEGAPMPPESPSAEIAGHLDEMIDRLYILGAPDSVVESVRAGWEAGDDAFRERLRRMNDVALTAEIRLALADDE